MKGCWQLCFNFQHFIQLLYQHSEKYGPLSDIILSGNSYNFHILSLNSLTKPFADIPSVIVTKYAILDNLSHTTRIIFFSATNSNLMMKSTIKCIHSLLDILFAINFPTSTYLLVSLSSDTCHICLYTSSHSLLHLVSRSLTMDLIFIFISYFIFIFLFFSFLFLFLEQLGLGVISHAVTSVTT